jgi:spermidine synthase
MRQWEVVESAFVADGSEFILARHGDDWVVRVDQRTLMGNRMHDSEEALAEQGLAQVDEPMSVLIGGLGLGYTLRGALDCLSEDAHVTVAELVPELVDWNRKHIGHFADHPLEDPRCSVFVGDVFDLIRKSPRTFDAILLDVDNGPQALAQAKNQRIYTDGGVAACHAALRPDGVLGVWSAGPNARYERRLARFGFDVDVVRVPARVGSRAMHVLFLGKRGAAAR